MVKTLSLILFFLYPFTLLAQAPYLTGKTVNDETNAFITGASVQVINQKQLIFQTSTDTNGLFKIPYSIIEKSSILKITALNFKEISIATTQLLRTGNSTALELFRMKTSPIQLDEVKVKAKKRYRDTARIDLSKEKFERTIMIDDMFSRYGFSKDKNGVLYYKGKPVADITVNGEDFFENNNDVYNLIPAMALNNIEVIETNIDSITNTVTLRPSVKVNLKFKEKYTKGKFGNASAGLGTTERYLAGTGLYTYKGPKQISLLLNSNNINVRDIPLADPPISFSANGNNAKTNGARLSYDNVIAKKLTVVFMLDGKIDKRNFESESERQDETINQYSKTKNNSDTRQQGINDSRLKLGYKIDSTNTILFAQKYNNTNTHMVDSMQYLIKSSNSIYVSNLNRKQEISNRGAVTDLTYNHLFKSNPGRYLNITLSNAANTVKNIEHDDVYNVKNTTNDSYYVDGTKHSKTNSINITSEFNEPLSETSYLNIYSSLKKDRLDYKSQLFSDSLSGYSNNPAKITNYYSELGFKFSKTFAKASFDGKISGLLNERAYNASADIKRLSFFNLSIDLKSDYRINPRQDFTINYSTTTNYPETNKIVNINNTFDLISQLGSNLYLKPEVKNSIKFSFNTRHENSGGLSMNGNFDYYTSKIALRINTPANAPLNTFYDNIGSSISGSLGAALYKNAAEGFNYNYNVNATYQQQPISVNNKINLNSGITISQSFSTTVEILKNTLSVSPLLSGTYTRFYYETSTLNVVTLAYSDKVSLNIEKFRFELYPLVNYSHSINSLTSASFNAGIKRNIFDNGVIWIQGYDLFNSFKFNNNIINPAYTQIIKYSNTSRYFIIGLSFKFNNIK